MKSILIFPTEEVKEWVDIERNLLASFDAMKASEEAQKKILKVMKVSWQHFNESNLKISSLSKSQVGIYHQRYKDHEFRVSVLNEQIAFQQQAHARKLFLEKLLQEIESLKNEGNFYS